jgi:hypothetical protein
MYTRVNDIMRLDHEPGSSLDEVLLAASLKALTTDQFSTELVRYQSACKTCRLLQCGFIVQRRPS